MDKETAAWNVTCTCSNIAKPYKQTYSQQNTHGCILLAFTKEKAVDPSSRHIIHENIHNNITIQCCILLQSITASIPTSRNITFVFTIALSICCKFATVYTVPQTRGTTSIRHWSYAKLSDRCLINVNPMVFAICDGLGLHAMHWLSYKADIDGILTKTFTRLLVYGMSAFKNNLIDCGACRNWIDPGKSKMNGWFFNRL